MTAVEMDRFWPMAEGPHTPLDFAKWKRMAMLWSKNGVVRGAGEGLVFHGWVEPGMCSIGSGALWLMCAYGELGLDPLRHSWIATPGDDGMIVAYMDPNQAVIGLAYQAGYHGGDFIDPNAAGQISLWELNGYGNVTDRRRFVPDVPPPPPVTVIPDRVPGRIVSALENDTQVVMGHLGNPLVHYVGWRPDYVPGRHWRFTADLRNDNWNATSTSGWFYTGSLFVFVRDASGVRMRFKMGGPAAGPQTAGTSRIEAKVITFAVPTCWGEMLIAFEQHIGVDQAFSASWGYAAGALRLEAEEIGADAGW